MATAAFTVDQSGVNTFPSVSACYHLARHGEP